MSRLLTITQAAEHCGMKPSGFRAAVKRGVFPGPVTGLRRYDKLALDMVLNKLSGIEDDTPDEYEIYKRGMEDEGGSGTRQHGHEAQ